MSNITSPFEIGLYFTAAPSIRDAVHRTTELKYNFCCIPLVHPRFKRDLLEEKETPEPFTRPDIVLNPNDWSRFVYGTLSEYLDVDVIDPTLYRLNKAALNQEISLAMHLGVRGIMFTLPLFGPMVQLAQIINQYLANMRCSQFVVKIPLTSPLPKTRSYRKSFADLSANELNGNNSHENTSNGDDSHEIESIEEESLWRRWNRFRTLCGSSDRLKIALEVGDDFPSEDELKRWQGEPLEFILLHTDSFILDKGCPILTDPHKLFLTSVIHLAKIVVLNRGYPVDPKIRLYSDYLYLLWEQCIESMHPYGPELESLTKNLALQSYEDFENDTVKYTKYKEAISKALLDKQQQRGNNRAPLVLIVLRAGKGPMVNVTLNAANEAGILVKIYAVDDHPEAFMSLQTHCPNVQNGEVEIIDGDVRKWSLPMKADILISDLLGSFGDNEMCSEYINAMRPYLKSDSIIIPKKYTSYICPVHSSAKFKSYEPKNKNKKELFVADLSGVYMIDSPQQLFKFVHSSKGTNDVTVKNLTFEIKVDCLLHGFYGFFKALLYDDVIISTVPGNETDGLHSWFPVYIQNEMPIYLKKGNNLNLHMWRTVSEIEGLKYSWYIDEPTLIPIQCVNSRLELHDTIKFK